MPSVSVLILTVYIVMNIVNALVGIDILAFARRSKQNVFFFLSVLALFFWNISLFASLPSYSNATIDQVTFFARLSWGFGLLELYFTIFFFLHLGDSEDGERPKPILHRIIIWIFSMEHLGLLFITMFTPFVYTKSGLSNTGDLIDYFGPLFPFYVVQILVLFVICIAILISKIKKSQGIVRTKLSYTLFAFIFAHLIVLSLNVMLPSFGDPEYYLLGGVALAPLSAVYLFIILRYRFLGGKLVLWKTFEFLMGATISTIGVFGIKYILHPVMNSAVEDMTYPAFAILIYLCFKHILFVKMRPSTKFQNVVNTLVQETKGAIPISDLQNKIIALFKSVGVEKVEIFLIEGAVSHVNLPAYPKNELTETLQEEKEEILYDDLQYQERTHTKKELALLIHLSVLDSRACFPLFHQDRLIGMLHLGKKKNDDPYFAEEIPELRRLADYIASFIITISLFRQEQQTQMELKRTRELSKTEVNVRRMIHDMKNNLSSAHAVIRELKSNSNISSLEKVEEKLHDLEDTLSIDDSGMQRTTVEVYPFLLQLLQGFEDLFAEKQLTYSYKVAVPKDLLCYLDRRKAKSVLENLLYNAYKFTPRGDKVTVNVQHFASNNEALITITNTGVSIPEDLKETIFEEGYTSDHKKGTGTGLHTVRKFVTMSGGEIHECGKVGKNVVFTIKIPLLEPPIHVFHRD